VLGLLVVDLELLLRLPSPLLLEQVVQGACGGGRVAGEQGICLCGAGGHGDEE
jgi:hypothetical protein